MFCDTVSICLSPIPEHLLVHFGKTIFDVAEMHYKCFLLALLNFTELPHIAEFWEGGKKFSLNPLSLHYA